MYHAARDDYVIDVLLPSLAGHDRSPAAFLVHLVLWTDLFRSERRGAEVSPQILVTQTGLSKSAVQGALRLLRNRSLIKVTRASPTAVAEYRRRAKKHRVSNDGAVRVQVFTGAAIPKFKHSLREFEQPAFRAPRVREMSKVGNPISKLLIALN